MRRPLLAPLLAVAALAATGCSHAMHVTNLEEYRPPLAPPTAPARSVGLTARNLGDPEVRGYVDGIAEALRHDPSFDRVYYPYDPRAGYPVDAVFDVEVLASYEGRGTNFFVNFPGFLIFAPAIWGYGYQASIDTRAIVWTRDGTVRRLDLPTVYQFRHASIGRTWTEIGWLEVGIIPFVSGFVFMRYNEDLTPEFVAHVAPSYGAYVEQRLREFLGPVPARPVAPPPAAPPPAPPPAPPAAPPAQPAPSPAPLPTAPPA